MLLLLPETRGRNIAEMDGGTVEIMSAEPT
jgi:hypothetical protein